MKTGFPFYLNDGMANNKNLRVDSSGNIYSFSASFDNTCSETLYGKLGEIFTRRYNYGGGVYERTYQWLMEDGRLCLFTKSSDSSDFGGQIRRRCI